jgi:hypothetical protein
MSSEESLTSHESSSDTASDSDTLSILPNDFILPSLKGNLVILVVGATCWSPHSTGITIGILDSRQVYFCVLLHTLTW